MRIPLPERFRPRDVLLGTTLLFVLQMLAGTDVIFALLTAVFIWLWALGVSAAGGVTYTSGGFIFFNGLLTVVLGLVVKALLFQPAERNLLSPRLTMVCYCIAMTGLVLAAVLCRALRPSQPLLKDYDSLEQLRRASIVCLVLMLFSVFALGNNVSASGSFVTAIRQINRFPLMTIILATTYEIRISNGKRSINWIVTSGILFNFFFGLIYFSKEGMLIGPTAWFITCVILRFEFSKLQVVICIASLAFTNYYLVPYSQYVRLFISSNRSENIATALYYLSDLPETRRLYLAHITSYDISNEPHLFDEREGGLDRLIMLGPDDALINYTSQGHVFGLMPIYVYYANLVPHFLWKDKPDFNAGNHSAHEIGLLPDDDLTTGVSFSLTAEAFHEASWLGLMIVVPLQFFLTFIIVDSLGGSAKQAPWAILWLLEATHNAPEGGVGVGVYMVGFGVLGIVLVIFATKIIAPFIMNTLTTRKLVRGGTAPFLHQKPHLSPLIER